MDTNAGEILKQALSLPPDARAALADSLLNSLDTKEDAHAREQWLHEIRNRIAELDSGVVQTASWPDVRIRLINQIEK